MGEERSADEEVVYAPANATLSGVGAPSPPSVAASFVWMKGAESVDKASVEKILDAAALGFGIAGVAFVVFRAGKVYLGVGSIKIATDDYWLVLF